MTPLLFDFNGTMFQDTDENEIAWKEEIFRLTKHKVTEAEFKEYLQGTINEEIIKHYLGKDTSPALVTQYALDKETIYRQLCLKRADGMSAKKDAIVNMGGLIGVKNADSPLLLNLKANCICYEGFYTYGGLNGRDLETIALGLYEGLNEDWLKYRLGTMSAKATLSFS